MCITRSISTYNAYFRVTQSVFKSGKAIVKEFAVYKYLKEIINIISGKCYSFYTLIVYPIKFNKN